jgi:hypothetical protein
VPPFKQGLDAQGEIIPKNVYLDKPFDKKHLSEIY